MKVTTSLTSRVWLSVGLASFVHANNVDLFNYGYEDESIVGGGTSYGQRNWDQVTCDNLSTCRGYPNKFLDGIGFSVDDEGNNCRNCREDGPYDVCGLHRQSPIDLKRDRAITGHTNEKECPDWHWMQYRDDTCDWEDMTDQFEIARHSLKLNMPILPNGEYGCQDEDGRRQFPRLDYSKGFPDWWWMNHMEITVPSSHTQEGKQYAAEVILAHFYQIEHVKNQLGHVVLFLDDYEDAEPWPYLDKLICQWRKEEEKVRESCGLPPAKPYGRCQLFRDQKPTKKWLKEAGLWEPLNKRKTKNPTNQPTNEPSSSPVAAPSTPTVPEESGDSEDSAPTASPTASPTATPTNGPTGVPTKQPTPEKGFEDEGGPVPPSIDCTSYRGVSYDRMCHSTDPCCNSQRSDTSMCWDYYDNFFPGDLIYSACYHCCPDEQLRVGPPNPPKPGVPKTIQCSDVDNPFRMCKENSCCRNPRSTSPYCESVYNRYGNDMEQICHYCCREPKEVGPRVRSLRSVSLNETIPEVEVLPQTDDISEIATADEPIPEGAKVTYVDGRKVILRKENFDEDGEDEDVYFQRLYNDYKHRSMQEVIHEIDYEDVEYWPYEWMLKVGTEYYYRYEGTQMVPPCWEVVHWRVMKDPIKVHKRQIRELNRLLAWRRSPSGANRCQPDTAGVLSRNGKRVALNREIQYYHTQHRKVFCECKDWPSKFEGDQEWCKNWKEDTAGDRFYKTPYSFDTQGEW